jgi:xanthine dehydrogenase accessory factor
MTDAAPCSVCVTITAVRGSAPREAGACMLVRPHDTEGSIGGGRLEYDAIATARRWLSAWTVPAAQPEAISETAALGPHLGQCCGGVVTLRYQPWFEPALPPPPPLFHLQLHGAGHVGRALVAILATLPCVIDWIDSRADAFTPGTSATPATPAQITRRSVDPPESAVAEAPPGCRFLVMTHSHALDAAITAAALQRPDAGPVGLIGSATKRARFEQRWRRHGIAEQAITRLICPIGVAGIPAKQPAVLAIAIAAQLLQLVPEQGQEVEGRSSFL